MSTQPKPIQLFGRTIAGDGESATLVSQIVAIFRDEIRKGRWALGERLPSISELARASGVNRGTLQYAVEKLAELGIVRQERYRGAFLASHEPVGVSPPPAGLIGVLINSRFDRDPVLHAWHYRLQLSHILDQATERGYSVQVQTCNSQSVAEVDSLQQLFTGNIAGIISLSDFPREIYPQLTGAGLPQVFWRDCYNVINCFPFVGHDQPMAFYLMTRELIARGHRRIAYLSQVIPREEHAFPTDQEMSVLEARARFEGYAIAMREAGLPFHSDREVFEVRDLTSLRRLLAIYDQPTALVCGAGHHAWKIVLMAEMIDLRIPQSLSVVAPGPASTQDNGPLRMISGADFDGAYGAQLCFNLIEEQHRLRGIHTSRLLLAPRFVEGCTIGPPRD